MNAIENLDQLDMRPSYSALLVLPTGGGKTYVASSWLIKAALDKGKKVLWLAHRTLLLDQAAEAFQEYTYEKDRPPLSPFRYRIVSGTSNHCRPSSISPKDDLLLVSKDSVTRKKSTSKDELYYSALDLAIILSGFQMDCRGEAALMERIWEKERPYFQERYRYNKHQLFLDILYWEHYLSDKDAIDREFPVVKKDILENDGKLLQEEYAAGFSDFNRFFKNARLRILYGPGNNYVRVKRRILLEHYHFQRMSAALRDQIQKCLKFYHLGAYLRGGVPCKLEDTGSEDMIVFKIADG